MTSAPPTPDTEGSTTACGRSFETRVGESAALPCTLNSMQRRRWGGSSRGVWLCDCLFPAGLRGTYQGLTATVLKQGSNQAIRFYVMTSFRNWYKGTLWGGSAVLCVTIHFPATPTELDPQLLKNSNLPRCCPERLSRPFKHWFKRASNLQQKSSSALGQSCIYLDF